MPLARFAAYRELARRSGYCEPFVPYVGPRYGAGGSLRVVYCGVAAWYAEPDSYEEDDAAALRQAARRWSAFIETVETDGYGSAFWRLGQAMTAAFGPAASDLSGLVWTNLSKLNSCGVSAPPQGDTALRTLDAAQLRHEIETLRPDLMVCVSGSRLVGTGRDVFSAYPEAGTPRTPQSVARRLPGGGLLFWTMHPNYKPAGWREGVVADLRALL